MFKFACSYWLLLIAIACLGQSTSENLQIPGTTTSIALVCLPAGNLPQSSIEIPAFKVSTHEITYDQYLPFLEKEYDSEQSNTQKNYQVDAITRPSPPYLDFSYGMGTRGGYPAVSMTQQAALRYCQWLYVKTGVFFRLPTEAEWEYACRAGSKSEFYYGDDPEDLDEFGWFVDNSDEAFQKTGQKKPNAWGLYDMLGNVSEWTLDQYREAYWEKGQMGFKVPQVNPKGKYGRTVRGGAYDDNPEDCSCVSRLRSSPKWQARDPQIPKSIWWNPDSPFVGFRIVSPSKTYSPEEVKAFFEAVIVD